MMCRSSMARCVGVAIDFKSGQHLVLHMARHPGTGVDVWKLTSVSNLKLKRRLCVDCPLCKPVHYFF